MSSIKQNITKIKIAQKQLHMDDDTYRALLHRLTGKSSATDLSVTEQHKVLAEMERLGFKPSKPKGKQYTKPHSRKLIMCWRDLWRAKKVENGGNSAMEAWVKRMTGKPSPDWLTPSEANKLIENLKQWLNRPTGGAMKSLLIGTLSVMLYACNAHAENKPLPPQDNARFIATINQQPALAAVNWIISDMMDGHVVYTTTQHSFSLHLIPGNYHVVAEQGVVTRVRRIEVADDTPVTVAVEVGN